MASRLPRRRRPRWVDNTGAYVRRVTDELREALAKNDDANTRKWLRALDKVLSRVWECDGGPMHLDTEAIVPLLARAAARQQHAKLVAEVFYVVGELSALPESLSAAFNALAAALNVEAGATNPDRGTLLGIVNCLGDMWAQGRLSPSRFGRDRRSARPRPLRCCAARFANSSRALAARPLQLPDVLLRARLRFTVLSAVARNFCVCARSDYRAKLARPLRISIRWSARLGK